MYSPLTNNGYMLIIAVGYENIILIERQRMLVNNGMSE